MAGAGTQTSKLSVPRPTVSLLKGVKLKRWDDELPPHDCLVKTDEFGLVLGFLAEGKDASYLDLSVISDVRIGPSAKSPKDAKTRETLLEGSGVLDERLISVAYGSNMVDICFINFGAPSIEVAKEFAADVTALTHNVFHNNDNVALFVRKAHAKLLFTTDSNGRIPVRNVYNALLAKDEKKQLQSVLKQVGLPTEKADFIEIDWFGFDVFYHIYCNFIQRRDIEVLFSQLSGGKKPHITRTQLREFLNKTQRDPRLNEILYPYYTDDRVQALIDRFEMNTGMAKKGQMTVLAFQKLLQSDENRLVDIMQLDLTHDMTQPLSHYFINSSHNTYLTGHQLTGKSSVEIYKQALLSGCRCVELDCWDGTGADQEPMITHGYTMCTEIVFKDVINAINEAAFVTSDYPVVLSFENHCSAKQQQKMAEHCRDIFKDKLLSLPYEDFPLQEGVPLPNPERMRGKILIKNKKKKETGEEAKSEDGLAKSRSFVRDDSAVTVASELSVTITGDDAPEVIAKKREQAYSWEGQSETNLELAELVNYFTPVRFKSFDEALAKNRSYEMSSMSETPAACHLKVNPVEFVNYNKRQISRVYPKGSRYDSSNYMPQVFWNVGCQMVSLNVQTCDVPFQLHLGKFEFNRMCGYLLKPVSMRRPDKDFDPFAESPIDSVVAATVKVKVISAQMLCDRRCTIHVELEMYGLPTDTVRRRFKTKAVQNNLNITWDEDTWEFKKVVVPELAMLRFAVYEDGSKLLGQRVLPLPCIQAGYRHINLRNEFNQPLGFPSVFVEFTMSDYIPKGMADLIDALANPIAYQSEVQKREKQLEELYDDDETDGVGDQSASTDGTGSTSPTKTSQDPKQKVSKVSVASMSQLEPQSSEGTSVIDAYTLTREKTKDNQAASNVERAPPGYATITEQPPSIDELKEDKELKKLSKTMERDMASLEKKIAKSSATLKKSHDKELNKWKSAQAAAKSKKNKTALEDLEKQLKELTDRHGAELHDMEILHGRETNELKKQHIEQEHRLLGKLMKSVHTVQMKRIDSKHTKDVDIEQKKSSRDILEEVQKFREEEKNKAADKDELERKVREHRNKLAKQTAEKRNSMETQRQSERQGFIDNFESRVRKLQEEEAAAIAVLEEEFHQTKKQ